MCSVLSEAKQQVGESLGTYLGQHYAYHPTSVGTVHRKQKWLNAAKKQVYRGRKRCRWDWGSRSGICSQPTLLHRPVRTRHAGVLWEFVLSRWRQHSHHQHLNLQPGDRRAVKEGGQGGGWQRVISEGQTLDCVFIFVQLYNNGVKTARLSASPKSAACCWTVCSTLTRVWASL